MATKSGMPAALEQVMASADDDPRDEPEQVEMFEPVAVAQALNARAAGGAPISAGERRPGRPPGAKNRRTVELVDFLERRGRRNPLDFLSALWSAPTDELAVELGCDRLDVVKLQRDAASAALPYWISRMPTEGEEAIKGLVSVMFSGLGQDVGSPPETDVIDVEALPAESVDNSDT